METPNNQVLVTWDFTNISQYALEHAVLISRSIQKDISLIHIISSKISEKEIEDLREKMIVVCNETEQGLALNLIFLLWKERYSKPYPNKQLQAKQALWLWVPMESTECKNYLAAEH